MIIYERCICRWLKQKFGLEKYNYKPTIGGLLEMLRWVKKDLNNRNKKIQYIIDNSKQYKILTRKDIKCMMR